MFHLKSDQAMDEDFAGMYNPDEDEDLEEFEMPPGELTEQQREYIKDLYENFDIDKSGALSPKELRKSLQILGLNPTVREVQKIMRRHKVGPGSKGNKNVTYELFEQILKEEILTHLNTEFDLVEAFRQFDRNKNGTLERDELKRCLTSLGESLSEKECDDLFDQLDHDGDGSISIKGNTYKVQRAKEFGHLLFKDDRPCDKDAVKKLVRNAS